jgi:pimeloyl-ACP methyl ester carboxylesterase
MKNIKSRNIIGLILATISPLIMVVTSCTNSAIPTTSTSGSLPIISEYVSWQIGDTIVAATVTRPDDKAVHPAVVLVAGSGPTDRDWNSPLLPGTNGSARLLAEELVKNGYVTIRYDKRVAGPNAEKNLPLLVGKLSMKSHVDELAGAVNKLLDRSDVNSDRIFILANSEGTMHALNYQLSREPKFAGLILQGMPGYTIADTMRAQIEPQVAALPNAQEIMAGYDKLMADFLADRPFVADPVLPEVLNSMLQGLWAPMNLPFMRELLTLNPASLLGKVTEPTLVMIGQKDIQTDYQRDGMPLEAAAKGHDNVSFVYPENADHVLKYETRPRQSLTPAEVQYNSSDRVLDADALKIIIEWLGQNN